MDFYSNPFNITINAGDIEGRGNVSINFDSVVEEMETFDMILTLVTNNPLITLSGNSSVGAITDSTGKSTVIMICGIQLNGGNIH